VGRVCSSRIRAFFVGQVPAWFLLGESGRGQGLYRHKQEERGNLSIPLTGRGRRLSSGLAMDDLFFFRVCLSNALGPFTFYTSGDEAKLPTHGTIMPYGRA
jgi:hypothetical protein